MGFNSAFKGLKNVTIVIAPKIDLLVGSNASPEEMVSKCHWLLADTVYN